MRQTQQRHERRIPVPDEAEDQKVKDLKVVRGVNWVIRMILCVICCSRVGERLKKGGIKAEDHQMYVL